MTEYRQHNIQIIDKSQFVNHVMNTLHKPGLLEFSRILAYFSSLKEQIRIWARGIFNTLHII